VTGRDVTDVGEAADGGEGAGGGEGRRQVSVGLVGRNIAASRSPWLHEREGRAQGLDLRYRLFDFVALGRDASHLDVQLQEAERAGYAGLNVTYPYKQSVIPLLHELSAGAARIGAVNTVQFRSGRRIGHNTDATGFAESLRRGLPGAALASVLQVGAGGGGSATAQALLESGTGVLSVFDSDGERARSLVDRLRAQFGPARARVAAAPDEVLATADGIVNATPVGMASHPGSPLDTGRLRPAQWVADIVYFPLETELLRDARARGCATLDGSGMAVYQAAAAFDLFTGLSADRGRMLRSFLESAGKPAPRRVGD
jgi:shikimate dehydrogenase